MLETMLEVCTHKNKPGFRYGKDGTAYTYESGDKLGEAKAKALALRQGRAIKERESSISLASPGFNNRRFLEFLNAYNEETRAVYIAAVEQSVKKIGFELLKLTGDATQQEVIDSVFFHLFSTWGRNFTNKERRVIRKFVNGAYREFRKDKSPFGRTTKKIPAATFDVNDARTIEYYMQSDGLYLGRFVTDVDTKKAVNDFIVKEFVEGGLPIGNNEQGVAAFRERFNNVMIEEDWKIKRIINTTVSKLRNIASVNYMRQAEIKEFEIIGISDDRQCPYCSELQGFRFSVEVAAERIISSTNSDPTVIATQSPFITNIIKDDGERFRPQDIRGLAIGELEALGIGEPPFHSNCRDTIIAVL